MPPFMNGSYSKKSWPLLDSGGNNLPENLDKRYQTQVTLWLALLISVGMYFVFSVLAAPAGSAAPRSPPNTLLIVVFSALGLLFVLGSFPVRQKLLARSVENQNLALVQRALVIACAMCEVSALLGLLEFFLLGIKEYYWLFLLAAGGIALHFPRRINLEAASYKSKNIVN